MSYTPKPSDIAIPATVYRKNGRVEVFTVFVDKEGIVHLDPIHPPLRKFDRTVITAEYYNRPMLHGRNLHTE